MEQEQWSRNGNEAGAEHDWHRGRRDDQRTWLESQHEHFQFDQQKRIEFSTSSIGVHKEGT
ncbi:hypothetical protein [Teichococcus vastitatis]|uniref:Uncharacterized protein n=1 Tax=Teichococcus vastitatis TaxID=2307076 RepID=A0ABS9W495_9PROT|nr:hypothetical protein [Pseudoroseomonas vastitatis]MCI0753878.1 hypothetical protein [Pseudoroseomonas vastitatis]